VCDSSLVAVSDACVVQDSSPDTKEIELDQEPEIESDEGVTLNKEADLVREIDSPAESLADKQDGLANDSDALSAGPDRDSERAAPELDIGPTVAPKLGNEAVV
jgi:hypothetical protein